MRWLAALLSAKDSAADSIIVGGLLAMLVLCGLTVYTVIFQHVEFSGTGFAGAVAVILGAIGTGKRIRDGANNAQPPQP